MPIARPMRGILFPLALLGLIAGSVPFASARTYCESEIGYCVGDIRNEPGCGNRETGYTFYNEPLGITSYGGGYSYCNPNGTQSGIHVLYWTPVSNGGVAWSKSANGTCAIIVGASVPVINDPKRVMPCPADQSAPDPGWGHLLP